MKIRQEQPMDYDVVYQVVKEAFANAEHTDGDEQNSVVRLRNSRSFIPELSLVAVEDEKIVGHILFTREEISYTEGMANREPVRFLLIGANDPVAFHL